MSHKKYKIPLERIKEMRPDIYRRIMNNRANSRRWDMMLYANEIRNIRESNKLKKEV